MRRLGPDDLFWIVVPVYAVLYNVFLAKDGRTLSEAWDRYLDRWPWSATAIRILARHLTNEIHPSVDPIGVGFVLVRQAIRRGRRPELVAIECR